MPSDNAQTPTQNRLANLQISKLVRRYIGVTDGYLVGFSYQSHQDFYMDLGLDIDPSKLTGTTRERFIKILSEAEPPTQAVILNGILDRYPPGSNEARTEELAAEIGGWAKSLLSQQAVEHPSPQSASEILRRALADAKELMHKNGSASAVDRMHTALIAYQKALCYEAGIEIPNDAGLTNLFKLLRDNHPALRVSGARSQDIKAILNSLNAILAALNPIRNNASVAHANEYLLADAEARLVIDLSSTLFHYFEAKVTAWRSAKP